MFMPLMGDIGGSPVGADERLRFLFAVSRDALFILEGTAGEVDIDTRVVVDANRAAHDLLGIRVGRLAGLPYGQLLAPSADEPGSAPRGNPERLMRRSDGQVLVVEQAVEAIESAGRQLLLVALHDVTTPRLLEKALMRMQQMDNLGVVSGAMVHDFRNLLVSIAASAELALQLGDSGEGVQQRLNDIVTSAARANEIVDRILPSSRVAERPLIPLTLADVVTDTISLIGAALPDAHAIRLAFPPDLPGVMGDESQLRQMVMNLVLNASQAIGDREGTISISASRIGSGSVDFAQFHPPIAQPAPDHWILVEVRDDGRGIDAATRARIFEPLFTTRTTGAGLGLTAVLVAVRRHSGAIAVRSRPGRGATFRVLLPLAPADSFPSR